ncbi:hypothetical protein GQR58_030290 [Nymphon striatum]|nr:hypothetical protein GQR58_030290 [Nymphon striatum]
MVKHNIPIIILAAGASSRMRGRDKLLEDIDGEPLLRHQALRALAVTDAKVLIALPVSPHPRYNVIDDLAVQTVPVPDAAEGMGASLRVAFASLPKDAPCAMLVLADLPDVTADDLGAAGHPVVFHRALFPAFAELHGDIGAQGVVAQAKGRISLIPLGDDRARRDLDTPQEWEVWRKNRLKDTP